MTEPDEAPKKVTKSKRDKSVKEIPPTKKSKSGHTRRKSLKESSKRDEPTEAGINGSTQDASNSKKTHTSSASKHNGVTTYVEKSSNDVVKQPKTKRTSKRKPSRPKQRRVSFHSTSMINLPVTDDDERGQENLIENADPLHKSSSSKLPPSDQDTPPLNSSVLPNQTKTEGADRVHDAIHRVLSGHFNQIPTPLSKLVRVFTSSTFTDTTVERNALMEDIYPALKRYCRETHGLDFQVVDMRWGIRDEATDDHMTTNLCINEIHNCQRLSTGPNFVVFLCQKYGYRPLPSQVLSNELEMLKKALKEQHDDVSVLDLWYTEDTNAVPGQFILQPISSILVNFNNKRIPKLQEQDAKSWWDVEGRIQNLLRKGARICHDKGQFTYEQMHNYYMSVTEREIIHGILKARNPNEHCLCYVRQIKNININQTSTASKFIDIVHKQINEEAQKLLNDLRDVRVPEVLKSQNIRKSCVEWAGREGMDPHIHADYIKEFLSDFYNSITNMVTVLIESPNFVQIDSAMRKNAKYRDPFFSEILQHLTNRRTGGPKLSAEETQRYIAGARKHIFQMWNGIQGSSMFYGRELELEIASTYLRSSNDQPMIFYGENGCGKTSILARIATESRTWLITSSEEKKEQAGNCCRVMSDLLNSAYNYNPSLRKQCPTETSKLFQHFKRMTTLATKDRPLIIILDSLDFLSKMDGTDELLWFPPKLPSHVKVIASLNSGTGIEMTMRKLIEKDDQYVFVPSLGPQLGQHVIEKWLEAKGRTLTPTQWNIVAKALSHCTLPLFSKLIYATVARWKSYSKPQEVVLFKSVEQSIHALYNRTESQHGKLLVSHALSYITAAKSGISDSELEDLISLDDKVLDDIYQYHLPPVRRIPPLLWSRIRADLPGYLSERAADGVIVLNWYHEQFRTAANERYFKNLNHLQNTHSAIADYFLGIWGGIPKPYQYTDLQKQRFGVVENEGLADRKVPKQPNIFRQKNSGTIRYNSRKLNELPYHLLRARRWKELFSLCLFNYEFLQAKLCCFPLQVVISDYEDAISKCEDPDACRQLNLVMDGLRLSASLLSRFPWMLASELLGRLLPLVNNNEEITNLLKGCDIQAHDFNCFLPAHHCFHSPGGPLKYSMEEHPFAIFGIELSSDQRMLASISNQLIVWDVCSGDLTRVINPNIEGIFLGMAMSQDDKHVVAFTNNNQVVIMPLIAGEPKIVEPGEMENQMEIGKVFFTEDGSILVWSSQQFYLYDVEGTLLHREHLNPAVGKKNIIDVYFKNKNSVKILTWSGDKDDWFVTMVGREEDKQLEPFEFIASIVFFDSRFLSGVVCVEQSTIDQQKASGGYRSKQSNTDCTYALATFEIHSNKLRLKKVICDGLEDKANALFYWRKALKDDQTNWLVAITVEGFILCPDMLVEKLIKLQLPPEVRNIPIKPMHSTSAIVMSCASALFVAGVRKNLYIFNLTTAQLVHTVDAHFGRILNLRSVTNNSHNILISSSIDRSIKIWNMENIFEKSFSVLNMDQPIERILIPYDKPAIAVFQTRKCIGLWDIRSHKFICTLVTNQFGSVVSDCAITNEGKLVVSVESDQFLVWDLKTQSVRQRLPAPQVHQIFLLYQDKMVGILYKQVDTNEQKSARLVVYRLSDLVVFYSYEYPCRQFKDIIVQKDTVTIVVVVQSKGHDQIQVISISERAVKHKFRPRPYKKQSKDMNIHKIMVVNSNPNHLVIMDNPIRGAVWDIKNKKIVRHLPTFTGVLTQDGRLGLSAPNKGGLHIIDIKTGGAIKPLIENVTEGVNDVKAMFTSTGEHVLYYHGGHQTLRAFRVSDGQLIGTFRPHTKITTWSSDPSGERIVTGGQDGSLLTLFLYDEKVYPEAQKSLASLPSRGYLAAHLGISVNEPDENENIDIRSLTIVTKAIQKFKNLAVKNQNSSACSIQ